MSANRLTVRFPLALGLALFMGLSAACTPNGASQEEEAASASKQGIEGLTVSNARLVLPAVKGNPAAVYFDLAYDGDRALTIRRADVEGAKNAMLHQYGDYQGKLQMMEALPIPITKGTRISFKPGDYHVMAMGLPDTIEPGQKVTVTLTVSGGDQISFPAVVKAAGDER